MSNALHTQSKAVTALSQAADAFYNKKFKAAPSLRHKTEEGSWITRMVKEEQEKLKAER